MGDSMVALGCDAQRRSRSYREQHGDGAKLADRACEIVFPRRSAVSGRSPTTTARRRCCRRKAVGGREAGCAEANDGVRCTPRRAARRARATSGRTPRRRWRR
eukprot:1407861-Pleurochrysis_carterae.AAC.1